MSGKTESDDGAFAYVQMAPCGAAICGTIIRTFNAEGEYQSENIGKVLVIDMVPQGDGEYSGSVWRPSNDKIYIGTHDRFGQCPALARLCCGRADLFRPGLGARAVSARFGSLFARQLRSIALRVSGER